MFFHCFYFFFSSLRPRFSLSFSLFFFLPSSFFLLFSTLFLSRIFALIFYSISSIQYESRNKGIQLRAIMKMCNNNDIINVINLVRIKFDLYYGQ